MSQNTSVRGTHAKANARLNQQFFGRYTPPDVSLVVRRSGLARAKVEKRPPPFEFPPDWPPDGWEGNETPLNDSEDAIRQWFDYWVHPKGTLRLVEGGIGRRTADCRLLVRDAWRLARHLKDTGRSNVAIKERPGACGPHDALVEMEAVQNELFHAEPNPPLPPPPKVPKKIPPAKRTRPMSLKEAARLMGYTLGGRGIAVPSKKAAESLRNAMDAGAVAFEKLTRKRFVFSRDDFPKESWSKILPKT